MKPKILFFGSDQYSEIVYTALKKDGRFQVFRYPQRPDSQPDVGILASFGQILDQKTLNYPKKRILNIHPSLLPKYRGPTPVPSAILAGEKVTGVTIFKMDEEVDHGPIAAQFKEPILPHENAEELLRRLFAAGAKTLLAILPAYLEDKITLRPQNHRQATYTPKFTRQDGQIDWRLPAAAIDRHIRAMHPWPIAWTKVITRPGQSPKRLKILSVHLEGKKLILDQVQLEGKKPVSYKQFREGYPNFKFLN